MITFNNIVSKFQEFCDDHFFIKTFSYGSPADVDLEKFEQYPLMHIVYTGGDYNTERTKTYNLEVYILTLPPSEADKNTHQKESISDAEQVAEDILADIQNGGNIFSFGYHYDLNSASITPLEDTTSNALAGCLLDLSISVPYSYDSCNAPLTGVEPEGSTPQSYRARGLLRVREIDGSPDVLSVATINVTNGSLTDNGDGVITLDFGAGDVSSVGADAPLSSTGGSTPVISMDTSGVTAGTYTQSIITVHAFGRVTSASDGNGLPEGNILTGNASGVATATSVVYLDTSNERVGIGTTSPTAKLHVSASNAGVRIETQAAGSITSQLFIQGDKGNGSPSVATIVELKSGEDYRGRGILYTNDTDSTEWYSGVPYTGGGYQIGYDSSGGQSEYKANSSLFINTSGNVGIGTTSPAEKLDVNGRVQAERFRTTTSGSSGFAAYYFVGDADTGTFQPANNMFGITTAGTERMRIDSSGNVGIGTTSPSAKLDVAGLANINDGSNNVMISSGNTAMTTGVNNTAVGYRAGYSNTTGIDNSFFGRDSGYRNIIGNSNSFFGRDAGYNNTGNDNSFLGRYAGRENTSGGSNSFLGVNAGYSNTTGNDNSFVGRNAGLNNTIGSSNSFIGRDAGRGNTTGNDNSFVGRNAGYNNTTGSNNVAIGREAAFGASGASTFSNTVAVGYQALYGLTTGANNTAVGYLSGASNTIGSNNSFVGFFAGRGNTSGGSNSFVGVSAGQSNTTGNSNSFVGVSAGYTNSTGSGNIFLGYQAGFYETGSNKLYIANSNTTTPLIYGEFDNEILNVNGKLKPNSITVDDEGLSAAGDYGPGAEIWYQGTSTVGAGGGYYLDSTGGWTAAKADAAATATGMLAIAAGTDSDVDGMVLRGFVQLSNALSGSVGDPVYLDTTTAGRFTTTKPTGTGNFVRRVGYLAKGTNVIYFNPSNEYEAL